MPTPLDIEGVWKEWDVDEEMREVFRTEASILDGPCSTDISTSVKYRYLLIPCLQRMAVHADRQLPPVEQLKVELDALLKHNKQGMETQFMDISNKGWAIKKLLGFVKAKTRRREVSTATGLHLYMNRIHLFAYSNVSMKQHVRSPSVFMLVEFGFQSCSAFR